VWRRFRRGDRWPLLNSPSDANSNSSDGSCPFWSDVDGLDKEAVFI